MPEAKATRPCPFCGERIRQEAIKCRFCGRFLDEEEEEEDRGAGGDAALRWLVPIDRSGWAIASGCLGLLSCFPFLGLLCGVLAVVMGVLALQSMKHNPRQGGRGRAFFGIILGTIAGLANLVLVAVMAYGAARGWK